MWEQGLEAKMRGLITEKTQAVTEKQALDKDIKLVKKQGEALQKGTCLAVKVHGKSTAQYLG